MKVSKPSFYARHRARRLGLQALYQWHISESNLKEIELEFHCYNNMKKVDTTYFHELLHRIPEKLSEVDGLFSAYLDRPIAELNPIELTVLRIASYELAFRLDVPYRVVLNEALELTKTFGAEEGYKYVNGVLDKVCRQLRGKEISGERSRPKSEVENQDD